MDLMTVLVVALGGALGTVARYLVVYLRRSGGDPQLSPWLTGRNHLHPAIHRVQDAIAADPARAWSVRDLGALTDVLDLGPRVVALGHDWGGVIVSGWALAHPDVLAGLVLTNTAVDAPEVLPAALKAAR